MIVVGGTYDEYCFEPRWQEMFGSGLRACWAISKLSPDEKITFHTFADKHTTTQLSYVEQDLTNLKCCTTEIRKTVQFQYAHPLSTPAIYPRPDTLNASNNFIEAEGDEILFYGLIEGSAKVKGKRVVYDPQSPVHPIPFSQTGSTADHLAVVVNMTEAKKMIGSQNVDIGAIKTYFFEKEKAEVVVLKMGPKGALVLTPNSESTVPVYKTSTVWPIGSGDIFAASFALEWLKGTDAVTAAKRASWNTATYCNNRGDYNFVAFESLSEIRALNIKTIPTGLIYLAGPFFTFAQRWIVDEIRRGLQSMGLKVFSPWHDVGHGSAEEVVPADIEALEKSQMIFVIGDGLDAGTIFEGGFAVAKKIPVLVYVQNETTENTKMLEGTGAILESDLTTAVYKSLYKSLWLLAEHE